MKTIEIKNRITGENIHIYTSEKATIKEAVEDAINKKVSLENANLENANLTNANLRFADLENSELYNANLTNANLEYSNLKYSNLEKANLEKANLYNANLENANLTNANLENANLRNADVPMYCKWTVSLFNNKIKIGCKVKTIEDWDIFFASNTEFETKRGTKEFKQIHAYYIGIKAYLTELNN